MYKIGLMVSVLVLCLTCRLQSQTTNAVPKIGIDIPVSPNAASLGKYGETPVGYYTGIPSVGIPIYTIQSGPLQLPVNLSYHAGGIKVEEIASWVGTGWSLNAGGVISRQIRGVADEEDGGYLTSYNKINRYLAGVMDDNEKFQYFQDVENGVADAQQDLFFFNFGGESGKFILDSTGVVRPIPMSRLKIELGTFDGQANCWKVTDLKGIRYYFTKKETNRAIPISNGGLSPNPSPTSVTSWYLSKIVDAIGMDSIVFVYEIAITKNNSAISQTKYLNENLCPGKNSDSRYVSNTINGWRLQQIQFKNGNIFFNRDANKRCDLPTDYALSSIEIRNTDSSFDKIYTLYHSYISQSSNPCDTTAPENNRLFLDSVQFTDRLGGNVGKFLLKYNPLKLPSRLSYSQDHWGYYNGANNSTNFVPTQYVSEGATYRILQGADRAPNVTNTQAGMLQSITYPTGGRTEFEFENNEVSNWLAQHIQTISQVNKSIIVNDMNGRRTLDTTFVVSASSGVAAQLSIFNGGGACSTGATIGCPIVSISGPVNVGPIYTNSSNNFLPAGTYTIHVNLRSVDDQTLLDQFIFSVSWPEEQAGIDSLNHKITVGGLRIHRMVDYATDNQPTNVKVYQYLFPDSVNYSSGFLLSTPKYNGEILIWESGPGGSGVSACSFLTFSSSSNYPMVSTQSSYVGYKYVTEFLGDNGENGKNVFEFQAPDHFNDVIGLAFPYAPATSRDWKRGQTLRRQSYRKNNSTGGYELIQEQVSNFIYITTDIYQSLQIGRNTFYEASGIGGTTVNDYSVAQFGTEAGWVPLAYDSSTEYDQNNLSAGLTKSTFYAYSDVHFQPISVSTTQSNGDTIIDHRSYPLDYVGLTGTDAYSTGIVALQNANMVTPVLERYIQRKSSNGTLIGTENSVLTSYRSDNFLPDTVWSTELAKPSLSFSPLSVSDGVLSRSNLYVPKVLDKKYDVFGNLVQQQKVDDLNSTYLWGYLGNYPIAKVTNADSANVAYTSFETSETGNWVVTGNIFVGGGATGKRSYSLNSDVSKSGLTSSIVYFVSYWTQNSGPFSISGTMSGYPQKGKTVLLGGNSWTLFVHKVTGTTTVSLSGSGVIDELRLYPVYAQMTTYTYEPLAGMISQTDPASRTTYYEYDGLARLKRIRDQDNNILKTYEYQYALQGSCGPNCYGIAMQTFAGNNTPGYPVGVFNVHGKLLGNATDASGYVSLWNSDTADVALGALATGADNLHFNITLNSGKVLPSGVYGCRYYQYDLAWNKFDGVRFDNGVYVDFGDGTGMQLPRTAVDTPAVLPPNTIRDGFFDPFDQIWWFIHSYPDTSVKTLTFYHNDQSEAIYFDNARSPAESMTKLRNFRGNIPQSAGSIGGTCEQNATALSVAGISNWNSISTIKSFALRTGDLVTPCLNVGYAQDFMSNNRGLLAINTTQAAYFGSGCRDTTFKLSRLKSDWNTYFTQLQEVSISDEHWDREDLSSLSHLRTFMLISGNDEHSNTPSSGYHMNAIPPTTINNVINQIAAGAGQYITNGSIVLYPGGTNRTSGSNAAVEFLRSKGWRITIDDVLQ
ncbi:MAG: hypothetical protein JST68_29395 [Bacteroidetes bacterium]|nr:hypothetical protein [Bacteroidota bacterium]